LPAMSKRWAIRSWKLNPCGSAVKVSILKPSVIYYSTEDSLQPVFDFFSSPIQQSSCFRLYTGR
jgi:hypothetical protein